MPLRISLGELFHDCATRFADRPCVTIAPCGTSMTYGELERHVNRLAHGIDDRLPTGSGHVAIMLENGIPYLAMSYALKKLGRIEVSINRAFRGAALARMVNLTECEYLLTSPAHFDALSSLFETPETDLPHLTTLIVTAGADDARQRFSDLQVLEFDHLLSSCDTHIANDAPDTDVAVVMFTSGTTGVSRGACCRIATRCGRRKT